MNGMHWGCLAIGVAIGYLVLPLVLGMLAGGKG
jgi:hypothetical protein